MVQPKGTRKATSPAPTLCRRQNKEPRRPVQGHTQLEIDTKPELWISVQCSFLFGDRGGKLVCIRLQRRGVSGVDKAKVSNAANHVCLANNKFQGCESRRTSPSGQKARYILPLTEAEEDIAAVTVTTAFRHVFHLPLGMEMSPDSLLRRGKHRSITPMEQAACRMAAMSWFPSKQIKHYRSTSYPQ